MKLRLMFLVCMLTVSSVQPDCCDRLCRELKADITKPQKFFAPYFSGIWGAPYWYGYPYNQPFPFGEFGWGFGW